MKVLVVSLICCLICEFVVSFHHLSASDDYTKRKKMCGSRQQADKAHNLLKTIEPEAIALCCNNKVYVFDAYDQEHRQKQSVFIFNQMLGFIIAFNKKMGNVRATIVIWLIVLCSAAAAAATAAVGKCICATGGNDWQV